MKLFLRGGRRGHASLDPDVPSTKRIPYTHGKSEGKIQVDTEMHPSSDHERGTVSRNKKRRLTLSSHSSQKTYGSIEDLLPELLEACSDEEGSHMQVSAKEKMPGLDRQKKSDVTRGMPVYLEETGERLGTIVDLLCDKEGSPIGIKIKDDRSQIVRTYTLDQFERDRKGLIFLPGWYTKTLRIIKQLEFKERTSPWLSTLLLDEITSNNYLYDFLMNEEEDVISSVDEAMTLKKNLLKRLNVLEQRQASLKNALTDITEKRLMGELDHSGFSDEIQQYKQRLHIIIIHIRKCKQLVERLDQTIFSSLAGNTMITDDASETEKRYPQQELVDRSAHEKIRSQAKEDTLFKEKYETLKTHYDQLNHEHQELKIAVEKLMNQTKF
jgi:hypothetical protein